MLSPLPRQVRETKSLVTNPSTSAFPKFRVGRLLHYGFRGLFSVHSHYGLQTRQVALCDPLHRRLRRLCCLHRRSNCYRVERSSSRAGLSFPLWTSAFSRRTEISPSLTVSAVSSASLSALTRALQRERHFALVEVVPDPTKARSQSVSGLELSPTHPSLRSHGRS